MADPIIDPNAPPAPPVPPVEPPAPPAPDMVTAAELQAERAARLKSDKDLQTMRADLEKEKAAKLREKQNWEELAKMKEQEADEYKNKYEGLNNAFIENAKNSALREAAQKAGILAGSLNDIDLLDFPEVSVETGVNGSLKVLGADRAIESLKRQRAHWFSSKAPSINPNLPETIRPTGGLVTLEDLDKYEKAYKANPQNDAVKDAYYKAIQQYKSQS